jgi:GWxTD domain-containing protein
MKTWKHYMKSLLLMGIFLGCASALFAQPAEIFFSKESDLPDFFYDVAVTASPDSGRSRIRCYTKIAYDELQFMRDADGFRAKYELSVVLFDAKENQVDGKIQSKEIAVQKYDETVSRSKFSVSEILFDVVPGQYKLVVSIMDLDSKKAEIKKIPLTISKRSSSLDVSDLILADRFAADSSGNRKLVPSVAGNFSDVQDTLFLWFEIYSPPTLQSVPIRLQIFDQKGKTLRDEKMEKNLDSVRTACIIPIPKGQMKGGRYKLDVTIGEGHTAVKRSKNMSIRWMDMPSQATDLDQAIAQLQYIAKGREIKKMKKLEGDEKMAAFKDFWKQMDPTPGTDENELMEEYYRRVDYTNRNFTTFRPGWKTDRGMVYIILGPPNEVERHPFDVDSKPYEIWTYYSVNRYFVFVDYSGFGDYHLEGQFWDVLNQIR